jgi:hypothetical protein
MARQAAQKRAVHLLWDFHRRMDLAKPTLVDHEVAIAREENAVAFVEDCGVMRLCTFWARYVLTSDGRRALAEDSTVRKT